MVDIRYTKVHILIMTNTERRIEKLAKTMGKAIAKLAQTDATAAAAMSRAAQGIADDIRAGRL